MIDFEPIATQNEALVARRFGRILYTRELLESNAEAIRKLYTKVTPITLTYDMPREIFELVCISDDFEPTEIAQMIPQYQVQIKLVRSKKGKRKSYYISFFKVQE